MVKESSFVEYARQAVEQFISFDEPRRNMMVDAVNNPKVGNVLDVGCGAGHQLLPFAEKRGSFCVGIDIDEDVGSVGESLFRKAGLESKSTFLRARGEELPFEKASFDVVICQVSIPYMDNRKTIAEIARVLRIGGKFFLKIHSPAFYVWMIKNRLPTLSVKQLMYPLICLTCGTLNLVTGKHPEGAFWKGKEVYQTKRTLEKELAKNNLQIVGELMDTNIATPSFIIEKVKV